MGIKLGHRIKIARSITQYVEMLDKKGNSSIEVNVIEESNLNYDNSNVEGVIVQPPKREKIIEYNELGEKVITYKNVKPNSTFDGEFDEKKNENEFKEALEQIRQKNEDHIKMKLKKKVVAQTGNKVEMNLLRNA